MKYILNIKNFISDYFLVLASALTALFTYLFMRRGNKIKELERDLAVKDLEKSTAAIKSKIEDTRKEITNDDKTLAKAFNDYHANRIKYEKLREQLGSVPGKSGESERDDKGV